jgi:hypothetical protein
MKHRLARMKSICVSSVFHRWLLPPAVAICREIIFRRLLQTSRFDFSHRGLPIFARVPLLA